MSSLFLSLSKFSAKRENAIKEALINTLSENSREIQYELKQQNTACLELCEATTSLCATVEAIFLHGLKDSLLWQTINVISGDVDRRPEPSFWPPLLVFLHSQVIEQVQSLSQVTSEVGQCRAWIRIALNESLLSSYLSNMRRTSSALKPYYKNYALLKDNDGLEMAARILGGMEACAQFNLPVNSSFLNQWPDYALQLSGLWTPPLKSCPISSGVDVAGSLQADTPAIPTPQPLRTNELFSESISNSPFSRASNFGAPELNQRESVDLFLQKMDELDIIDEEDIREAVESEGAGDEAQAMPPGKSDKARRQRRKSQDLSTEAVAEGGSLSLATHPHGNSLTNLMQTSWSSELTQPSDAGTNDDDPQSHLRLLMRSSSQSSTHSVRSPLGDRCSYNALLRKHERNREVDWTEVWEKFLIQNTVAMRSNESVVPGESEEGDPESASNESHCNSEFEVVSSGALEKFDLVELQEMVEELCRLAREPGLDAQGFLCRSCQHPLGIGYSNFQVCAFSGFYYCDACMDVELFLIPARIIYNWDFRKYAVSKRAATFLAEFRCQPFIDLKLLNPDIYNAADAMAELQSLRIRLNFIRAYLQTCALASIDELQRQFFGREYLYEHIHQYSIGDLAMIQRGTLGQLLQKAYKAGEAHILRCALCSVKGFICEICNSPRVLYPFHIDTTFRCKECGAVFHPQCLNEQQPCPKCERKRKREDLPLQDSVEFESPIAAPLQDNLTQPS